MRNSIISTYHWLFFFFSYIRKQVKKEKGWGEKSSNIELNLEVVKPTNGKKKLLNCMFNRWHFVHAVVY